MLYIGYGNRMVTRGGLEPPRCKALPPQGSVSTIPPSRLTVYILLEIKYYCLQQQNRYVSLFWFLLDFYFTCFNNLARCT